jgi:hypothetical protein
MLLEAAASTASTSSAFARIEGAFRELYAADPTLLMFQLQSHAAAGDDTIRAAVRQRFMDMVDEGVRATGAPRTLVLEQIARGVFMGVAVALDLPDDYRLSPGSRHP